MDVVEDLREGDVYRWSYRESGDDRAWGRYHCCSCIAIVHHGRLRDTYWQIGNSFSEGKSFGPEDLGRLNLTRIANMDDLKKAQEYEADYYDDADIVNLNHANSTRGNFYLRKGALRSKIKMLEVARRNLELSQENERSAARLSKELAEAIARILDGEVNFYIPSPPNRR